MLSINTLLAAARGPLGARLDPYQGHNFLVEIDGLLVGGFSKVSGLSSSVLLEEYAEGGQNGYLHQLPGETRYPPLVLTRGLTEIDTLYRWYCDVAAGRIRRRDLTLMLLDSRRQPVMWWNVHEAIPVKWIGPTFDAERDAEVAVESLELVHHGIKKPV